MTTAMSGDEWESKPPWYRRALMWLGHNVLRVALALAVISLALELAAQFTDGLVFYGLDNAAAWIGTSMMLAYFASDYHDDRLCDYCLHGRIMESGTESAERNDRWLRYYHRIHSGPVWKKLAVVAVFTLTLAFSKVLPPAYEPVVRWLSFAAFVAWIGGTSSVTTIHRWNRLYCKYCKHPRDDRDDEPAPDWTPPPDPTGEQKTPTPTLVRLR
jgi:hypothetical protein